MRWLRRTDLAKAAGTPQEDSILFGDEPAEHRVALSRDEIAAMRELSRRTFEKTGLAKGDRVLFAIRRDGSPSVELLAQAVAPLVSGVALTGPKGRLRLLSAIQTLKPSVLVTTACGAADFLARLYMEFNIDPLDLDLQRILLVGEIASPGVAKRIAKEFEAELVELYCDPIFGAALACRKAGGAWDIAEGGVLAMADLANDALCAERGAGPMELILRPSWSAAWRDAAIRTGQVAMGDPGDAGLFNHTVGEHVLVRGRWVSLPLLRRQLGLIDGIAHWSLMIDRGDRTLDSALLAVAFERESLVANPMWKGRIAQAIGAATAIHIDVATALFDPAIHTGTEAVIDRRFHHLGVDRAKAGAA